MWFDKKKMGGECLWGVINKGEYGNCIVVIYSIKILFGHDTVKVVILKLTINPLLVAIMIATN